MVTVAPGNASSPLVTRPCNLQGRVVGAGDCAGVELCARTAVGIPGARRGSSRAATEAVDRDQRMDEAERMGMVWTAGSRLALHACCACQRPAAIYEQGFTDVAGKRGKPL